MANHAHTIQEDLELFQKQNDATYFVETGTFNGDTTEIARHIFKKVFSIELHDDLYEKAKKRFSKDEEVEMVHGDSSVVLPEVLKKINGPTVFFLDAHWAGDLSSKGETDTPILEELHQIQKRVGQYKDVIVIDDISWVGKKESVTFQPEWKSKYFPDGGIFEYDWTHVCMQDIFEIFGKENCVERNDRLIITT